MSGDRAAVERFYRDSYPILVADLLWLGVHRGEVDDAISAGVLAALNHWDTIESPRAYVRAAAFNHVVRDRQRGQWRIVARLVERGMVRFGAGPETEQVIWEQEEWVKEVLASLPPAQREVMACVVDALRPHEIAELLGKNPAAVRQNLRAARERLKQYLAETNDGWPTGEEER